MNCPRQEEASAYLDEMLTRSERQQFAVHLAQCPACRQRLDELRALQQDLHALPSPALGYDLAANLESRLRRGTVRHPARSSWSGWGVGGLAVALSLACGAWLGALLIGAGGVMAPPAAAVRVFDPVPPGGLCAAAELCALSKGMK